MTTSKTCCRCGADKPLSDFPVRKTRSADGRAGHCLECNRKRQDRRWRQTYLSKHLEQERARLRTKFKERVAGTPEHKARVLLRTAVRLGKVMKPTACEVCLSHLPTSRIQGHHHDYNKPLDVKWLCVACHAREHAFIDRASDGKREGPTGA